MKPKHIVFPKIKLWLPFVLVLLFGVPSQAQVEELLTDQDVSEGQLEQYNEGKEDLEQLIKARECVSELEALRQRFIAEIQFIDSLCQIGEIANIPKLTKDNKLLIVAKPKEGRTCVLIRYEEMKFLPGCPEPFFTSSIDWSSFENILAAKKEGTLCLVSVQSSGYTQVEKIPSAELTKKSADRLLNTIERVLMAYQDKIGVSFKQYQDFEAGKNLSDLKDIMLLRTAFLNKCKKMIQ